MSLDPLPHWAALPSIVFMRCLKEAYDDPSAAAAAAKASNLAAKCREMCLYTCYHIITELEFSLPDARDSMCSFDLRSQTPEL